MKHVIVGSVLIVFSLAMILIAVVADNAPVKSQPAPSVIMEVLDPSLDIYANAWRAEIGRRFPNAVGILCHGGDLVEGQWVVRSDNGRHLETADAIAAKYQAKWPGKTIVLLSCDPGHLALHVPGVYHAMDSVWCVPDRATGDALPEDALAVLGQSRWAEEPGIVGNIFEFVTD